MSSKNAFDKFKKLYEEKYRFKGCDETIGFWWESNMSTPFPERALYETLTFQDVATVIIERANLAFFIPDAFIRKTICDEIDKRLEFDIDTTYSAWIEVSKIYNPCKAFDIEASLREQCRSSYDSEYDKLLYTIVKTFKLYLELRQGIIVPPSILRNIQTLIKGLPRGNNKKIANEIYKSHFELDKYRKGLDILQTLCDGFERSDSLVVSNNKICLRPQRNAIGTIRCSSYFDSCAWLYLEYGLSSICTEDFPYLTVNLKASSIYLDMFKDKDEMTYLENFNKAMKNPRSSSRIASIIRNDSLGLAKIDIEKGLRDKVKDNLKDELISLLDKLSAEASATLASYPDIPNSPSMENLIKQLYAYLVLAEDNIKNFQFSRKVKVPSKPVSLETMFIRLQDIENIILGKLNVYDSKKFKPFKNAIEKEHDTITSSIIGILETYTE